MKEYIETLAKARETTRAQEWGEAAELWTALTRQNPTIGAHFTALGVASYRSGQYERAAAAFACVVERGSYPDYELLPDIFTLPPDVLTDFDRGSWPWGAEYFIACCHAQRDDKPAALDALERALRGGYRYRFALRDDERLNALRHETRFQQLIGVTETPLSRDVGWQEDVRLLGEEIERIHFDPFRCVSREKLRGEFLALADDVPHRTDTQIVSRIMQILALLGAGHTQLAWWDEKAQLGGPVPLGFFLFEEGLFITEADPFYREALGLQVLEVGGRPVSEILTVLESCVSRDNPVWLKAMTPLLLQRPALLHALDLIPSFAALPLLVTDEAGGQRTLTVPTGVGDENDTARWVTLPQVVTERNGKKPPPSQRREGPYSFTFLPDEETGKTLYFLYTSVANDVKEPFDAFCQRMFAAARERGAEKIIVDVRRNFGGNSFLLAPLFQGIGENERFHRRGGLFVIAGRGTFSAAMNCAAYLERNANAIFAGEPTGTSPNFVGETVIVRLPHSGLPVGVSDLYWQGSWPMDRRPWIPPLLYAPPTFADYRLNRDAALEAVLAFPAYL